MTETRKIYLLHNSEKILNLDEIIADINACDDLDLLESFQDGILIHFHLEGFEVINNVLSIRIKALSVIVDEAGFSDSLNRLLNARVDMDDLEVISESAHATLKQMEATIITANAQNLLDLYIEYLRKKHAEAKPNSDGTPNILDLTADETDILAEYERIVADRENAKDNNQSLLLIPAS